MTRQLTVALLLVAGCADPTAVDLRLAPDPTVNRAEDVLAATDRLVLVVDAEEPLYLPGEEWSDGLLQIENADGDPSDLELVVTVPIEDRLPLVRLERGGLPDVPLELRLLGLPAAVGAPAAVVGRVQGVRPTSPPSELAVPFNLRPELLPPRITEVLPSDGGPAADCGLDRAYLMFSRPVDPATLEGAVRVEPGRVVAARLDPSGLTAELEVADLIGAGETLAYRLEVAPTLRDLDGRALDQVPAEAGAQGFESEFTLICGPATATTESVCGDDPGPGGPTCPFPDRLACVDGYCVPRACEAATCSDGSVCDASSGACVLDCRPWGEAEVCPAERPRCDDASGVCVE